MAFATALFATLPARAAGPASAGHDHGHHAHAAPAAGPRLSLVAYTVPATTLVRADGQAVSLAAELADTKPVLLNFIFTTCTAICPVMSHVVAQVQQQLGADSARVHMVSISIDPEQDTPARLREYAQRHQAGAQWQFYTGTPAASIEVQKAFAAWRGDKMNHEALTLLRPAPGAPWLRIEGLAPPDTLAGYLRSALADKAF